MFWFSRNIKGARSAESFTPQRIRFIGEQAGPVEDELKVIFSEILSFNTAVQSAYLARISYDDSQNYSVVLCIRCLTGVDSELRKQLGDAFTARFRPDQHLDTLFMRADQEAELKKVCRAFYEKKA